MRNELTNDVLAWGEAMVAECIDKRIRKHGAGAFVSAHEGFGVIAEEYHELAEAMRSNDPQRVMEEAMDVAVGAMLTAMSLKVNDDVRQLAG